MSNERILSYKLSNKLSINEAKDISSGVTSYLQTSQVTYGFGGSDVRSDMNFDL